MIARQLDQVIDNHYNTSKSAILLTGARQVGKTYAIRQYAKRAGLNLIEINFFALPQAQTIFDNATNIAEVLLRISTFTKQQLKKGKTLIFFDEVQLYPDMITWVKFLVDEGSYLYALSGSLLGVTLKDIRSIPVGYMSVIDVYPLDFKEFAKAVGVNERVLDELQNAWNEQRPVDEVVHESMLRLVRFYLMVGGMPAVVQTYLDTNDMQAVRQAQKQILGLYHWDIAQYDPNNKLYLDEIFRLIPSELNAKNKRFILKNLNEHRQFSRHENGFIWLRDAGVALPTYNVAEPTVPLLLNTNHTLFKLFQNDVGLLAAQYDNNITLPILQGEININYGAIFENFVAQELKAHGWSLNYYNSKKQGEVDFIIERDQDVIPIEVKSGKDYARHRALSNLLANSDYGIKQAIVFCQDNLHVKDKIIYTPIYMLTYLRKELVLKSMIYKPDLEGLT